MLKQMIAIVTLTASACLPALGAGIGITGVKDSADFAFKYEADVLPDAAGLNFVLNDPNNIVADTVSLGGGVLTINTNTNSTVNDALWYQIDGGAGTNWDAFPGGDFSMEIRAAIQPNNSGLFSATVGMGDANSNGFFGLFHNKVKMGGLEIPTATNADGFHVFRVVSISDGTSAGQTYRVYRDGVQIGSDAPQITNFVSNSLRLGDFISGAAEINIDIDYLRWDMSGAYEPVPEPASLGLVLSGAALMVSRRRRAS